MEFNIRLTDEEVEQCRVFSENSARTQREHRSGGIAVREYNQIVEDTFRGKVAETAVKNFIAQNPLNYTNVNLDFDIYPRGRWDTQDFKLNNKKVAVKSAKWFSRWLLIETKDINRGDTYDIYILVTVSRDFKDCTIRGFATKDEMLEDTNTLDLLQGEPIPGTATLLDANNHGRHMNNLHNSEAEWIDLVAHSND